MSSEEKAFEEMKALIRNNETTLSPDLIGVCQEALRKCKEEYCNGWTNRETWLFNLHINNDELIYRSFTEMWTWCLDEEYPVAVMAKYMEEFMENCLDNLWMSINQEQDTTCDLISDLINSAIGRINFYEVAKNFMEE